MYFQRKINSNVHLSAAMKLLISCLGLFQCRSVILLSEVGYCSNHAVCHQLSMKALCSILNRISKKLILVNTVEAFCGAVLCPRGREIHGAFPLTEQVLHIEKQYILINLIRLL